MKICVLPGDGIGPEIMAEAVRILKALDLGLELEEALLGGCAVDATGNPYPEATQRLALAGTGRGRGDDRRCRRRRVCLSSSISAPKSPMCARSSIS